MTSQQQQDVEALLTDCRGELEVVQAQNENLKLALVSARRIGAAMGILMERMRITDDAAFGVLSDISQRNNLKLRDVAERLLLTGAL